MLFSQSLSLCRLGIACFILLMLSTLAHAQRVQVNVPAGPLPESISLLAQQLGVAVVMDEARLSNLKSNGVQGDYTAAQALETLLKGSGFVARQTAQGFVISAQEKSVLEAVKVSATALEEGTEGTGSLTTGGPVISATGLGLSLRETPQSVTVITRERLDQQNLVSLTDVAEQVPGLFYNGTGTPVGGRTWIYSRGFLVNSYQIDGVNVPWEAMGESEQYGQGSLDTAIYDSISFIRGATGLLAGAGEPSATVGLSRKKPTSELKASIEAVVGSWDRNRIVGDVGGPLNSSASLRGRIVGAHDKTETWVDGYGSDRSMFYGVLEADLSEKTLLTLTAEHGTADSDGAPWAGAYGSYLYYDDEETPMKPSTTTSLAPHWAYLNSGRSNMSATLKHAFSDNWNAQLTYIYSKFNTDMRRGMVWSIPEDGSLTEARVLSLDYNYDTHLFDVKLDGKFDLFGRQHDLVIGFNRFNSDQAFPLAYYGDIPDLAWWQDGQLNYFDPKWDELPNSEGNIPGDTETQQQGAYIVTRVRPTDAIAVILGARTTDWKSLSADRNPYFVWDDREYTNEITPYAGVVVDINKTFSVYASYTQIFNPQYDKDVNDKLLDPEEGTNYELGIKGEWFDGSLNASVALFESRRDNLAVPDGDKTTSQGDQAYRAADNTEGQGWELEIAGELTPRWQIQGGYTRFKNEDNEGELLDTTQPVQQFKLYSSYKLEAVSGLSIGGGLRWQDKTYVRGMPKLYTIDSYSTVSANANYDVTSNFALSLSLDNVLDKEYRTANYYHSYGAPRNFTLTGKYSF